LPGDEIIGFITRGYGVSIHKKDCINVITSMNDEQQKERWVQTEWAAGVRETFQSSIEVIGTNRPGILADLSVLLNNLRVAMHSVWQKSLRTEKLSFNVTIR
jgi:GTP pyrophosphokinase